MRSIPIGSPSPVRCASCTRSAWRSTRSGLTPPWTARGEPRRRFHLPARLDRKREIVGAPSAAALDARAIEASARASPSVLRPVQLRAEQEVVGAAIDVVRMDRVHDVRVELHQVRMAAEQGTRGSSCRAARTFGYARRWTRQNRTELLRDDEHGASAPVSGDGGRAAAARAALLRRITSAAGRAGTRGRAGAQSVGCAVLAAALASVAEACAALAAARARAAGARGAGAGVSVERVHERLRGLGCEPAGSVR